MEKDLSKLLAPYAEQGLWVALSQDRERVISTGESLAETLQKAKNEGETSPSVIKAAADYSGYVLFV